MLKKLKQINEHLDKKLKLDLSNKFYINKNIFRGVFIILILYLLTIGSIDGFSSLIHTTYVYCPETNNLHCINPMYDFSCKITGVQCENEFIEPGETIGKKPSELYLNFGNIAIIFILGAFGLNYLDSKLKKRIKDNVRIYN